jgi:hypothetical protein
MPLDLGEIALQLEHMAQGLGQTKAERGLRLKDLLDAAANIDSATVQERTQSASERPYLAALPMDRLLGSYDAAPAPTDWCVAAVDGSHIDVDRHLPVSCFLVNLGGCVLSYGSRPDATFFSQPHLALEPEELYLTDPGNPAQEETVSGALLGLVRTVWELERLAEVVETLPPDQPALALVDGSLVLWGLSGQGYRPFVRDAIILDRFLPALERLRAVAQRQPLTLAAYVSLPRSTEVVNALRCCLCPHDLSQCRQSCSNRRSTCSPCDVANEFLDRDLFQALLPPGWRSPVYRTDSSVPRDYYGADQRVHFYYLNGGEEIGRVEVPQWVAQDEELLALSHSLVLDQCQRGQGYPVAISEAHEQAVVRTSDRRVFKDMVARALDEQGLPAHTSEKERSKRTPWV